MPPSHVSSSYSLSLFVTRPLSLLLFPNLYPSVSINTLLPSLLLPSFTTLISTLHHFLSFSICLPVCLSLLTVAIIKSCPVRYVAHGCYWCPFITHYGWVPVLVLTGHKLADTNTHMPIRCNTVAHTYSTSHRYTHTRNIYSDRQQDRRLYCFTQPLHKMWNHRGFGRSACCLTFGW